MRSIHRMPLSTETRWIGCETASPIAIQVGTIRARHSMAEGRTNVGIARRLWLTDRTVETHVGSILGKLGLANSDEDHRRVLAVLMYLGRGAAPDRQ